MKEDIAQNLTQGGLSSNVDWLDLISMAIPALSNNPETGEKALKYWQTGRTLAELAEEKRKKERAEQEGKALIAEKLSAEKEDADRMADLMSQYQRIQQQPSTVTETIPEPPSVIQGADFQQDFGLVPGQVTNQQKLKELADWSNEIKNMKSSWDAAAAFAKYPNAPLNIATTIMSEQFQLKKDLALKQLQAALDRAKREEDFQRELLKEEHKNKLSKELEEYKAGLKPPEKPKTSLQTVYNIKNPNDTKIITVTEGEPVAPPPGYTFKTPWKPTVTIDKGDWDEQRLGTRLAAVGAYYKAKLLPYSDPLSKMDPKKQEIINQITQKMQEDYARVMSGGLPSFMTTPKAQAQTTIPLQPQAPAAPKGRLVDVLPSASSVRPGTRAYDYQTKRWLTSDGKEWK